MSKPRRTIQDIASGKTSDWAAGATFRRENKWLSYSSEIALRILAAIEDKEDFSQSRLAEVLGVSPQQISKIVKGKENLTLETIYNLSKALDADLISFPEYKYSKPLMGAPFNYNEAKIVAFPPFVKAETAEILYPMGEAK